MTTMARFSSTCPDCGERWQPGDLIRAEAIPPGESPIWKHATCPDPELAIDFDNPGPSDTDLERHTPLAEQIAREHAPHIEWEAAGLGIAWRGCSCGERISRTDHRAHIATATEQAVRERIAADIEAHASAEAYGTESGVAWVGGWQSAIARTARIARGATP